MAILIILALLVVGYFVYRANKSSVLSTVDGRQHYYFDHQQFSTQDFYGLVEKAVNSREIPNVSISRVNFSEGGLLSAKREYLRVSRHNQTFDICAAPFGTGFFVSYWLGVKRPVLGRVKENRTYYQWDTENMYKASIKAAIDEAIDSMGPAAKGARALSDISVTAQNMANR